MRKFVGMLLNESLSIVVISMCLYIMSAMSKAEILGAIGMCGVIVGLVLNIINSCMSVKYERESTALGEHIKHILKELDVRGV